MQIQILQTDITKLDVDAIVNAANETLLGGGGVDGAIHRAAGTELLEACRRLPQSRPNVRCATGQARITPGFALPARWIIHTVGPVWHGGGRGEASLLASCYRESLSIAAQKGVASVAFPAISCGVFGYPAELAACIAVEEAVRFGQDHRAPHSVILCCFSAQMAEIFASALATSTRG